MSPEEVSREREVRLGEVVEAGTTEFVAQCYELYTAPILGSLVRCGDDDQIYGVVHEIATRSIDSGRRPIARGRDEDDEEAIYQSNPQLSRLLSTEFRALSLGHRQNGALKRWLAPLPPRIHSFVYQCSDDELKEFSAELDFVSILLSAPIASADDVLASFLAIAGRAHFDRDAFLVSAGKRLTPLLGGQMQRLDGILRRIAP